MKLKGKLILSCAALAAVATTAFSTTYAWYTSNTEVKATGIGASTAAADSSTLQISKDGSTWGATVDLTSILTSARTNLTPVERTANSNAVGTYKIQNDNAEPNASSVINPVSDTSADITKNVVQFDLYFRNITLGFEADGTTPKTCPVYIKTATITNAQAGSYPTAKLLTDITSEYKASANSGYTVDLLRALDVEIVGFDSAAITGEYINVDTNTTYTGEMVSSYKLDSYANKNAAGNVTKDTLSDLTGWDALTYYNTVKNGTASRGANAEPTTDLSAVLNKAASKIGTIQASNKVLKTTWTLYLDGWDKACFDAVKGQTISVELAFTTTPAN